MDRPTHEAIHPCPQDMQRSILIVLLLGLLAGCAGPSAKPTLRISTWGQAGDDSDYDRLVESIYQDFEKVAAEQGKKIDVRVEKMPAEYVPKMVLAHIAGVTPDVVTLDASSSALFVNNGMLKDLSPYLRQEPDLLEQFFPNTLQTAKRGEKVYAIPTDFTPMVVMLNRRHFEEAGIPLPKPSWTWDDFLSISKALTLRDKAKPRYGFLLTTWMPGWVMWLWNGGGEVLDEENLKACGTLDSPQNVATLTYLKNLVTEHKVAPALSQIQASGVDLFAAGQAAMQVTGHWALVSFPKERKKDNPDAPTLDDISVIELPVRPGSTKPSRTVFYAAGTGISSASKDPDLAWEYIRYWASQANQTRYNSSGIAISARKDVAEARLNGPLGRLEKEFQRIVPLAEPPIGSRIEGYESVENAGREAMESVLSGSRSPEQALRLAAERIDREFAKEPKK